MQLLIDDVKNFNTDIIARNFKAGMAVLRTGIVTHLYLDYDLGSNKTGADILKDGLSENIIPNKVELVSWSPPGLIHMRNILRDNHFESKNNANFERKKKR